MCSGHLLLCLPGPLALYGGVALAGWAFGSSYPLTVVTVGELFGIARVGSNYMVFDGAPRALGSLLLAKLLAQSVYQSNSGKKNDGGDSMCSGDECFRFTFMVVAILQVFAAMAAAWLAVWSHPVYELSVWGPSDPKNPRFTPDCIGLPTAKDDEAASLRN